MDLLTIHKTSVIESQIVNNQFAGTTHLRIVRIADTHG